MIAVFSSVGYTLPKPRSNYKYDAFGIGEVDQSLEQF